MSLLIGADSIVASELPTGLDFYGGYTGGNWPDFDPVCARFPAAHRAGRVIAYVVSASQKGRILDCENGDATPEEAGPWIRQALADGVELPGAYASRSVMPAVVSSIHRAGLGEQLNAGRVVLIVADWDGSVAFGYPYKAKQFASHGPNGENYDQCVARLSFFPSQPGVHRNPTHYDWFTRSQARTVKAYDRYRREPHKHTFELKVLRAVLKRQAAGVWRAAHRERRHDGRPGWNHQRRGWRYQELLHRSHGMRFV